MSPADEAAAQNAAETEMAGAPLISDIPDGASDFVAPPPLRRRGDSNESGRQLQRRRTSQLTFGSVGGGGAQNGGGVQHRVTPATRHMDMIDEVDNGNFVASRNMQHLSGLLNARNSSGVRRSQILTNIGSFVQQTSGDPTFAAQRNRAGELALTLLNQIEQDVNAENENNAN